MSATVYATVQARTESPREIELRAFRYVNGLLARASGPAERAIALHKTHRLWALLIDDLARPGNGLPAELRGKLVSLGLWAQREAMARLADGGSLQPLLALHRDMIEGLEAQRPPPNEGAAFGARSA
jgi:flagellar protein FlaF